METPVRRIFVLGAAVSAERKSAHRGLGAVVGDIQNDGEARSAVGAVDERVAITAVGGIEELAQAIVAHRHVGRDQLVLSCNLLRVPDIEAVVAFGQDRLRRQRGDVRQRRRFVRQRGDKDIERSRVAFGLDSDAAGMVQHPAAHAQPFRQVVHEGSKANALHNAGYGNMVSCT